MRADEWTAWASEHDGLEGEWNRDYEHRYVYPASDGGWVIEEWLVDMTHECHKRFYYRRL